MKYSITMISTIVAAALIAGCQPSEEVVEETPVALTTTDQKVSYGLGYQNAQQMSQIGFDADVEAFIAGYRDGAASAEMRIPEEEVNAAFTELQENMQREAEAEQLAIANGNLAEAEAFLAENGTLDDVITTASGLQYKIIEEGTGPTPTTEDTVEVHYEGSLLDGTVFDSSIQRGQPVEFGVTQVIPGWVEALQLMPEGSTWEVYIHPDLGYGPTGAGGLIGPNALLIFKVQLLQASVGE